MPRPDFEITVDARLLDQALVAFEEKRTRRVLARGVNRTGDQARIIAARSLSKRIGMKVKVARKGLALRRASPETLTAGVTASGRPLALYKLGRNIRQRKTGVSLWLMGARQVREHSFLARMPNGYVGIFERKEKAGGKRVGRLKIEELYGPSLGETVHEDPVRSAVHNQINERLPINILREIDREQRRLDGRARRP